jgi:hypothetical protein
MAAVWCIVVGVLPCYPCIVDQISRPVSVGMGCVWEGAIAVGWALELGCVPGFSTCLPRGPTVLAYCLCVVVATLVYGCPLVAFVAGLRGGLLKKSPFFILLPLRTPRCRHVCSVSGGLARSILLCRPCQIC